jgi:hypothetical protein
MPLQWIPVNWDTLGLEYFTPIKQLPQIYEVARKELYKGIRQKISFLFVE